MKNILLFLFAGLFFLNVSAQTDADTLSDMEDAYERYIKLIDRVTKKTKIPHYVYERIKECKL